MEQWRDKVGRTMIQSVKLQARLLRERSYRLHLTSSAWTTARLIMTNIWLLNFSRPLVWPTSLARSTTEKWISNGKAWSKCEGIWLTNLHNFCRLVISLERRLSTQRNISMILCYKKVTIMRPLSSWPQCRASKNYPQYNSKQRLSRKPPHSKRAVPAQMWYLVVLEAQPILVQTILDHNWED